MLQQWKAVNSVPKSHSSPAATSRSLLPHLGGELKEAVPDHEEEKEIESVEVPEKDPVMEEVSVFVTVLVKEMVTEAV